MRRVHTAAVFLLLKAVPVSSATLSGQIVDSRTGEPIAKVEVIVPGASKRTLTDQNGVFNLSVPAGDLQLYVTTVGYGLVKKVVHVSDGPSPPVRIVLEQDTAVRRDSITVEAGPFDTLNSNPSSEKSLSKSEIQALAMVLVGDPLRATQALPGVTSDNDFRSEFSVRGAAYERVAVYVDGILTDGFVHAANLAAGGLTSSEKLSLSIINSDNVSDITLLPGAFPSNYGERTAGVLDLSTRDGNLVKPMARLATGLLSTSATVDGPFAGHKGSWLLSGRTSYADYLQRFIERISGAGRSADGQSESELNFSDAQIKGNYHFSPRQQAGLSAIYGLFAAGQTLAPGQSDLERLKGLHSHNLLVNAFWRYTPGSHLFLETKVFGLREDSKDTNRNDALLDRTKHTEEGFRADLGYAAGSQKIDAGVYTSFTRAKKLAIGYPVAGPPNSLEDFDRTAAQQSYYLQDTWRKARTALTVGGRVAHSDLTAQTIVMPRVAFTLAVHENWTLRLGAGTYAQFPDFDQLFGFFGNRALRAEHTTHFNGSVERRLGTRTRILAEVYDREDRNQPFGFYEPLLVDDSPTALGRPYRNVLRGHARGGEISVQRRSANGLTGWVSYSYLRTQYLDAPDQLRFVSDFDQRNTITAFASYRLRPTVDLSTQWRYGSGTPFPGFFDRKGGSLFLGAERNTVRLPYYSRLDLRMNKAFLFPKWKLTVSAEVLNVLNRKNLILVSTDPVRVYSSGRLAANLDSSFGVLPSVAIAVAF